MYSGYSVIITRLTNILMLILTGGLLLVINSYKVLFSFYIILSLILVFGFFSKHNIKGWYLGSLFIMLYTIPHFFYIYLYGENLVIRSEELQAIASSLPLNIYAIKLTILYILSSYAGYSFFRKIDYRRRVSNEKFILKTSKLKKILLTIFILSITLIAIFKMDFQAIKDSYKVGAGFSILFGVFYITNFLIVYVFLIKKFKKWFFTMLLIVYVVILGYLGVRQVIFWLLLGLFFSYIFEVRHIKYKSVNYKKLLFYFILFIIVSGVILSYRSSKVLDIDLDHLIHLIGFAYLWEASFTTYNFLASIELSKTADFFFMNDFFDVITLLIPSFIFPNKGDYLVLGQFSKMHNITPFGTYFILGELKLSMRYDALIAFYAVSSSYISELFQSKAIKSKDLLLITLYSFFLVFIFIYPVRGTIPSGIKIFFMFNFLIYFLIKYKFIIRKI
jgi:hypothetical protein